MSMNLVQLRCLGREKTRIGELTGASRTGILSGHARGVTRRVPRRSRVDAVRRPAIRPLRRPLVVRVGRTRRPAADRVRSGHRARRATATSSARREFHGTVLLTHLHWDHVQGLPFFAPVHNPDTTLDVHGPRQADGAAAARCSRDSCARRSSRSVPTVSPRTCGSTTPATTTSRSVSPRCARASCATSGSRSGFRVEWGGRSVALRPRSRARLLPRRSRRLCPARHPRAVRRRRPADPRRAAHARRVRAEAPLGPLDRRLRGASRTRVGCEAARAVPPRSRRTATTRSTTSQRRTADRSAALGGPEVIAAYEGLEIDLQRSMELCGR